MGLVLTGRWLPLRKQHADAWSTRRLGGLGGNVRSADRAVDRG